VQESQSKAQDAVGNVQDTRQTLDAMLQQVDRMSEMNSEIASYTAQQRAAAAAIAMGMAGAMQAAAASMPSTTTTYGNSYGYGNFSGTASPAYGYNPWRYSGNYNSFGTYSATSTTYNPAATVSAQAAVNANTLQQMNAISANRNASLADLDSMLRTTTIPPGAAYGGNIVFKLPPTPGKIPKEILVTVRTPLDSHQIKVAFRKR
jgi:hypothetical protein